MTITQLKVANGRNSVCGSEKLKNLDWSNWWTDQSFGQTYLHVTGKDGGTSHRVFCRRDNSPRLQMRDGVLMWIAKVRKK